MFTCSEKKCQLLLTEIFEFSMQLGVDWTVALMEGANLAGASAPKDGQGTGVILYPATLAVHSMASARMERAFARRGGMGVTAPSVSLPNIHIESINYPRIDVHFFTSH